VAVTDIFMSSLLGHCERVMHSQLTLPKGSRHSSVIIVAGAVISLAAISVCTDRNAASGKYGAIQVRSSDDCSRRSFGRRPGIA
jgi:hypothetical protein